MAASMHPAADGALFLRRRFGAGLGRHRHERLGRLHTAEAVLVQPPRHGASPRALIKSPNVPRFGHHPNGPEGSGPQIKVLC